MKGVFLIAVLLLAAACRREPEEPYEDGNPPFALELPPGFEPPITPADNPLTDASVRLGKALFFDPRLSVDGTISCASCHLVDHAFSDTVAKSMGVNGALGMRNAPSLANLAYHGSFFRDGGVPTLEQQVIAPVHDPVEMAHNLTTAAATLRDQEPYATLSRKAYGKQLDAWVITRAIANYERTLISGWSRYDRYLLGDVSVLTSAEVAGAELFNSAELNCVACHAGNDFSDHAYHNVGQYLVYSDPGRERITLRPSDNGKFKTPTLRNIVRTAPYMHDGSMSTLDQVLDHFASGGQPHPGLDPEMRTFVLTAEQRSELLAFFEALTDERPLDHVR